MIFTRTYSPRVHLSLVRPGGARENLISGVPNPGLPEEYPSYLKPINVNSRDIEAALRAALAREEPELIRFLYSTWTAQADAIKYQEIRNALRDGEFDQALLDQWRADYVKFVNDTWWPTVEKAMTASADLMLTGVNAPIGSFSLGTANIQDYLSSHAGELIEGFTDQLVSATRSVLQWGIDQHLSTEEVARYLRPIVGLNSRQAETVAALRDTLQEAGMADAQIINRVENYAAWLNRERAMTIAQTEISNAFREGQLESMRGLVAPGGWLEGEQIVKIWRTAPGCCEECGSMDGESVPIDQPYSNGLMTAGAHPHCYCIDEYLRVTAEASITELARYLKDRGIKWRRVA